MKNSATGTSAAGWPRSAAALAALTFSSWMIVAQSRAQVPDAGTDRTVQGTVERLTTAPMGEIDGAVMTDGTVIHWPPHLAEPFSAVAAPGERVRVVGWMETTPEGGSHLEVRTVTNLRTQASAENVQPTPGPAASDRRPAPRRTPLPPSRPAGPRVGLGPANSDARTVEGTVQRLTTAPMGEIDGALLDDGTFIHWPPHLGGQFAAVLTRGDRVRVMRMEWSRARR